jgi:hypothetical protein
MRDALHYFPARPLRPNENALVAEWLAGAGDIAAAYVSNRRTDDPAHYRRIRGEQTGRRTIPPHSRTGRAHDLGRVRSRPESKVSSLPEPADRPELDPASLD